MLESFLHRASLTRHLDLEKGLEDVWKSLWHTLCRILFRTFPSPLTAIYPIGYPNANLYPQILHFLASLKGGHHLQTPQV